MDNCMSPAAQMDHHALKMACIIYQILQGIKHPGLELQGGSARHLELNKGIPLTDVFIGSWPIVSLEREP